MIIPVKCDDGSQKWDLIELQGVLQSTDGSPLTDKQLGKLVVNGKTCTLTIGRHALEGNVVQEKGNLVILRKRKREEEPAEPQEGAEDSQACPVEYHVVGKIARRFHFKKRPELLLSS